AESDLENLHHRQVHPAEDDAVDRQTEIQRAKATQKRGWLAGVTQFGKLNVSHHAGATPESRVEKDREHAAHDKVPPEPISRDPVFGDEASDSERGVGREGSGNHRSAGQPPGHVASGEEKLAGAAGCSPRVVEADAEVEKKICGD